MKNLLIGVVFVGLGAGLCVLARDTHRTASRYAAQYDVGTRTIGQLVAPSRNGKPLGRDYVAYTFAVGGRTLTANGRPTTSGEGLNLEIGQRVPVWYDAADPAVCVSSPERRAWESDRLWTPVLQGLGGLAILLIGVAFFRAAIGDRRKPVEKEIPSWAPGAAVPGRSSTRVAESMDAAHKLT